MIDGEKVWLESMNALGQVSLGMSSGLGATVADLPKDVKPGSFALDYTTITAYFYDGKEWVIANGD